LAPGGLGPLIVTHPDRVAEVLHQRTDDFVKSSGEGMRGAAGRAGLYSLFRELTRPTLGGSVGEDWRRRRPPVTAALRRFAQALDPEATHAPVRAALAPAMEARRTELAGSGCRKVAS
jgi:hypothetical protein